MWLQTQTQLALAVLFDGLIRTSSASALFSDIQPIIGFSTACTFAYDKPVVDCSQDDFRGLGGWGSCSADCQASLTASQKLVQSFCSGQQADGNSVIGHLFVGDIVNFLCGDISAAPVTAATTQATTTSTQTTTLAQSATTMAPGTTQPSAGTDATSSTSMGTTGTGSRTTLVSSTGTESSTTSSSSSSSSVPTSTFSATSSTKSATSTTSGRTSATGGSSPQSSEGHSGGGSPFDNTFNGAVSTLSSHLHWLSLLCIVGLVLSIT